MEESVISINELLSSPVTLSYCDFRELSQLLHPLYASPTPLNRHSRNTWRSNNLEWKNSKFFGKVKISEKSKN